MQNRQLWTAGSISKKLRGLLAKFWAKLQLFFKRDGLRVDNKKDGGFFNKTPGRNGILAYGMSDLDPMIRTYPDLDLISRVSFGSGGSERLGRAGGGAARRSRASRRSFTGGSNPGVPVADLGRGWVK